MLHTSGTIHIFDFEPGNGTCYRVQFGRLPPLHWTQRMCLVFGMAEGYDALITIVLDTDSLSEEAFSRRWRSAQHTSTVSGTEYLEDTAYSVFAGLIGRLGVVEPHGWRSDWRDQLPKAILG